MRKVILTIFITILLQIIVCKINAQVPQAFNYQAVVRNSGGNIITNQPVGVRISILQGSSSGVVVYSEIFTPTTNQFGLITLEIGKGIVVSGTFNTIAWSSGLYWLKIEIDPAGGSTYVDMGASQLLTVPYAMYAADAATSGVTGPTGSTGTNYGSGYGLNISGSDFEVDTSEIATLIDLNSYHTMVVDKNGGEGKYTTINDAITAINTIRGTDSTTTYLIRVMKDIYTENVSLPRAVSLVGVNNSVQIQGRLTVHASCYVENIYINTTTDSIAVFGDIKESGGLALFFRCMIYSGFNHDGANYCIYNNSNAYSEIRNNTGFYYSRNPNAGSNAKSVIVRNVSGSVSLKLVELKNSSPINEKTTLFWNEAPYLLGCPNEIIGCSWVCYHGTIPVIAKNDNTGYIYLDVTYANIDYPTNPYISLGNNIYFSPKTTGNLYVAGSTHISDSLFLHDKISGTSDSILVRENNIVKYKVGNINNNKLNINSNYTISNTDFVIIDSTTSSITDTIKLPINPIDGQTFYIVHVGEGNTYLSGNGKKIFDTSFKTGEAIIAKEIMYTKTGYWIVISSQ
jgi:hypothetical protein